MPGKYDSLRDSALHYLCSVEWSNESFGDVEAPTGFVWRISNNLQEVHTLNTEINSVLEQWEDWNTEVRMSEDFRKSLVGHFLITEDSNGFINVLECPSATSLVSEFNYLKNRFDAWLDSEDEENN